MTALYRARVSLLLAVGLATALLVVELPVGELLHQRSQLALVSRDLARVDASNAALSADVASLSKSSTIAAIAHGEYGLVARGERAYTVVAPDSSGAPPAGLVRRRIPAVDLVLPSADALLAGSPHRSASSADGTATTGSLWSRVVDRLAFWRWAF
ncbi:MAG TPA: septum formation initiator family protein [Acidimicrobiales bacterium]|nr:septum formation initiator family protein [Acidimicrobiales bacterium]